MPIYAALDHPICVLMGCFVLLNLGKAMRLAGNVAHHGYPHLELTLLIESNIKFVLKHLVFIALKKSMHYHTSLETWNYKFTKAGSAFLLPPLLDTGKTVKIYLVVSVPNLS